MIEIAVSVICYDNENEVLEFANKLSRQKGSEKIMLLVTCNKCKNIEQLREDLSKVKISSQVFETKKNLGYLLGCLYGFKSYGGEYKWSIISNTDIDFVSDEFFAELLDKHYDSQIGCIGPDITLKVTGKHQNPFATSRPTNALMKMRKVVYSHYGLYSLYGCLSALKNKIVNHEKQITNKYIYGAHGSIVILKKECVDKFIDDDIQIFMYGEELYIAEKLRESQLLSYYDTNLKIIHNENQVTGKIASRKKQEWSSQSINFLVDRYWK